MSQPLVDDVQVIADELLCSDRVVGIIQHIEARVAKNDYDTTIRALFAVVYEALRIGIEAGVEHGTEITCDRIAAIQPSIN